MKTDEVEILSDSDESKKVRLIKPYIIEGEPMSVEQLEKFIGDAIESKSYTVEEAKTYLNLNL
jgi:hypothetical protein